jgi:hypothetical protein
MDKQDIFHVADIAPGPGSSSPEHFVVTKHQVFFTADDNTTGRELYVMPANIAQLPQPAVQNLTSKFRHREYALGHRQDLAELLALLAEHNLLDIELEPGEFH